MKTFSSSAGTAFLLATSALHHTVNSFPTGSTTSMLPSDAYSTIPEDHTLLSKLHYAEGRFSGKLDDSLKTLNNSLTTWQEDNYSTTSPKSHTLSSGHYDEEDSFSNTLDDDSSEAWDRLSKEYPPLTTPEVSSTTPELSSITTSDVSSATPEANSTVSSTASSQEQTSSQGLWSYYIVSLLGLTILGAAITFIKNKFCNNETQGELNEEMNTFDPSDCLTSCYIRI